MNKTKIKKSRRSLTNKLFNVKEINKSILRQYWLIIALWIIVVAAVIAVFVLYAYEMSVIFNTKVTVGGEIKTVEEWRKILHTKDVIVQQEIYKAMFNAVFDNKASLIPVIWFSNMLFIRNFTAITNYQVTWDAKMLQITTSEVYMLISVIVAIAGLCVYLYLITQYSIKLHLADKKGFTNKYPLYTNDLQLFSTKSYVNFFVAIAIFFSFYVLSATLIMLIYMLVVKAIYKKISKINETKNISANVFNASDLSYFKMLFILMAIMISYNLIASFVTYWLNVDITTVLDGLFSAGGIAVIVVTLVRQLLTSQITDIKKKMKNIDKQIKEIYFFYQVRKGEAAFDYEYAQILPPVIKNLINKSTNLNSAVLKENFDKLFAYTDFIVDFDFNHKKDVKRKKFILYRMYNEITTFEEMEDIKINLLKEFGK